MPEELPELGAVFWPVGTGDSTTIVVSDQIVVQIDLHDMAKADDDANPEMPVVDRLVEVLPEVDDEPYLAVFALTHADKDHCLGFADLLEKVTIGELWATPRLWREYHDAPDGEGLCADAQAFQEEAERRIAAVKTALGRNEAPARGDRIIVIGYDTEHDTHAYDELPAEFKSGPGKLITSLDDHDCAGRFEAFIHAPFADDCAAERNDTSLAMQVTLTTETGQSGRVLLLGDLAHDTIMKIVEYSENHDRSERLSWDLLLAPHHCSKKVMYRDQDGQQVLQRDVLDAFERHAQDLDNSVIVASSTPIPASNPPGANPPHRLAADRYEESAELVCTMSWPTATAPSPVVFAVDDQGAGLLREQKTTELAHLAEIKGTAVSGPGRLARVAGAAAGVLQASAVGPSSDAATSPGTDRVRAAVESDRGGHRAPETPVAFG